MFNTYIAAPFWSSWKDYAQCYGHLLNKKPQMFGHTHIAERIYKACNSSIVLRSIGKRVRRKWCSLACTPSEQWFRAPVVPNEGLRGHPLASVGKSPNMANSIHRYFEQRLRCHYLWHPLGAGNKLLRVFLVNVPEITSDNVEFPLSHAFLRHILAQPMDRAGLVRTKEAQCPRSPKHPSRSS